MVNLESPLHGLELIEPENQEGTVLIRNLHDQYNRNNLLAIIREMQGTGIGNLVFDLSNCSFDKMEILKRDIEGMCLRYGFEHKYTGME